MKRKARRTLGILLVVVMLVGLLQTTSLAAVDINKIGDVDCYGRMALSKLDNSEVLLFAYDQIAEGIEHSEESITVYDGENAISRTELDIVMDAYWRDYTYHFWRGQSYTIYSNTKTVTEIEPNYIMTGSVLENAKQQFNESVAEILFGISNSMTDYQKELYLHDKLASTVDYMESANAHNAYGALVEGKAVCEGYADALQYLLQCVGIQSFVATGKSLNPTTNQYEGHAWNYVRIDGKYYHVDLTWDDQGKDLYHMYFNQTDAIVKEDHVIDATAYALPVCSSDTAQYFTGKEVTLNSYTAESVGKLLRDNDGKVHVYIPGDIQGFIDWFNENVLEIASEAGVTGAFYYSRNILGKEIILTLWVDEAKITFNDVMGQPGEEVVIPVTITDNPGIATFRFRIAYDMNKLTFLSAEKGSILTSGEIKSETNAEKETMTFLWVSATNISGDGEIAKLRFKISEEATEEIPLSVIYLSEDLLNENSEKVNYTVQEGKISLGSTVNGTITSFNSDTDEITIQLYQEGLVEPIKETVVYGNNANYLMKGVCAGTYTIKASKNNHVAREYKVVVGGEGFTQNVQLCLKGDVNMDGYVDYGDIQRLYQHISTDNKLVDYPLVIADINEDNSVDYGDIQRLYQHISTDNKLF